MVTRPRIDLALVRSELGSAIISDALDEIGLRRQCLGPDLSINLPDAVIAGYAYPLAIQRVADVPERPFIGLLAALDEVDADDVVITPTFGAREIAVWGELLSTAAAARGAAGAVTDGSIRDTRQILDLGFPVVSAGTVPYDSKGRHEVVAHRVPAYIDGVRIEPGDLVVADSDGVVVAPAAVAAQVVRAGLDKRGSEREFRAAVAAGMSVVDAFERFKVL